MKDFGVDIEHVINGIKESVTSSRLISPSDVDTHLKRLGLEQGNFDSNGWDWDFWQDYSKGDDMFTLSGSGWYNNGLTFSRKNK